MYCPHCANPIADDATFCPYCGQAPTPSREPVAAQTDTYQSSGQTGEYRGYSPPTSVIVEKMRSAYQGRSGYSGGAQRGGRSSNVVRMIGEPVIKNLDIAMAGATLSGGEDPPMVIVAEKATYLSNTTYRLEPNLLLERVQAHILEADVPVEVQLVDSRWVGDAEEHRPRLIAFMRSHRFSETRMVLGVDYLGKWAAVQMSLGIQPESAPSFKASDLVKYLAFGGLISFLLSMIVMNVSETLGAFMMLIGVVLLGFALFRYNKEKNRHHKGIADRKYSQASARLSRSFKTDDMHLFCTAMEDIFKHVVNDIVSQGAEVVRVDVKGEGFFQSPNEAAKPVARTSNAADSEV